jgi:hypothetical protein
LDESRCITTAYAVLPISSVRIQHTGCIAFAEGTDESARRAVVHFENQLRMNEAIGNDEGAASAKGNIAIARSMYEGGSNEEVLKKSQAV